MWFVCTECKDEHYEIIWNNAERKRTKKRPKGRYGTPNPYMFQSSVNYSQCYLHWLTKQVSGPMHTVARGRQ